MLQTALAYRKCYTLSKYSITIMFFVAVLIHLLVVIEAMKAPVRFAVDKRVLSNVIGAVPGEFHSFLLSLEF